MEDDELPEGPDHKRPMSAAKEARSWADTVDAEVAEDGLGDGHARSRSRSREKADFVGISG